jgi:hypothetical protein
MLRAQLRYMIRGARAGPHPGHQVVLVDDGGQSLLLSGDAITHLAQLNKPVLAARSGNGHHHQPPGSHQPSPSDGLSPTQSARVRHRPIGEMCQIGCE